MWTIGHCYQYMSSLFFTQFSGIFKYLTRLFFISVKLKMIICYKCSIYEGLYTNIYFTSSSHPKIISYQEHNAVLGSIYFLRSSHQRRDINRVSILSSTQYQIKFSYYDVPKWRDTKLYHPSSSQHAKHLPRSSEPFWT